MSRIDELRRELADLESAERAEQAAEQQRLAAEAARTSSSDYRRNEDDAFMRDYALRYNAAPRDNWRQPITVASDTERYGRIRMVEAIAPRLAGVAALTYGHDHAVTKYFRLAAGEHVDA